MTTIHDLPNEVLQDVLDCVLAELLMRERSPQLNTLHICQKWRQIGLRRIFRTVNLKIYSRQMKAILQNWDNKRTYIRHLFRFYIKQGLIEGDEVEKYIEDRYEERLEEWHNLSL